MSFTVPHGLHVLTTREQLTRYRAEHKTSRLALVPTMGFLHDGHLSLIRLAKKNADRVITSIFVNPTQFAPGEDLDSYPRDIQGDLGKAFEAGTDAVYLPSVTEMYPPDTSTTVNVSGLSETLCGQSRPTHFSGVCTVVLKLFNQVACDVAVFGEKDAQQLAIIRRMVRDLDVPVDIVSHPIVREPDGLALSSRNVHLSPEQRRQALSLSRALDGVESLWSEGQRNIDELRTSIWTEINRAPLAEIDYVDLVCPTTLTSLHGPIVNEVLVALAVRFGSTRLIDNRVLSSSLVNTAQRA